MERDTLKKVLATGMATAALGCGGLWLFGTPAEEPVVVTTPRPKATRVAEVSTEPKPKTTKTVVADSGGRRPRHEAEPVKLHESKPRRGPKAPDVKKGKLVAG